MKNKNLKYFLKTILILFIVIITISITLILGIKNNIISEQHFSFLLNKKNVNNTYNSKDYVGKIFLIGDNNKKTEILDDNIDENDKGGSFNIIKNGYNWDIIDSKGNSKYTIPCKTIKSIAQNLKNVSTEYTHYEGVDYRAVPDSFDVFKLLLEAKVKTDTGIDKYLITHESENRLSDGRINPLIMGFENINCEQVVLTKQYGSQKRAGVKRRSGIQQTCESGVVFNPDNLQCEYSNCNPIDQNCWCKKDLDLCNQHCFNSPNNFNRITLGCNIAIVKFKKPAYSEAAIEVLSSRNYDEHKTNVVRSFYTERDDFFCSFEATECEAWLNMYGATDIAYNFGVKQFNPDGTTFMNWNHNQFLHINEIYTDTAKVPFGYLTPHLAINNYSTIQSNAGMPLTMQGDLSINDIVNQGEIIPINNSSQIEAIYSNLLTFGATEHYEENGIHYFKINAQPFNNIPLSEASQIDVLSKLPSMDIPAISPDFVKSILLKALSVGDLMLNPLNMPAAASGVAMVILNPGVTNTVETVIMTGDINIQESFTEIIDAPSSTEGLISHPVANTLLNVIFNPCKTLGTPIINGIFGFFDSDEMFENMPEEGPVNDIFESIPEAGPINDVFEPMPDNIPFENNLNVLDDIPSFEAFDGLDSTLDSFDSFQSSDLGGFDLGSLDLGSFDFGGSFGFD